MKRRTQIRTWIAPLFLILNSAVPASSWAGRQTVKVTITGGDLQAPIAITAKDKLARINIWSGPGNFRVNGGIRTPYIQDGSIVWSQGAVATPSPGLPRYEVSFFQGEGPDEEVMYAVTYAYDPVSRRGYIYLPGKGEKWYDVNVQSIARGVEGQWFRSSTEFDGIIGPAIRRN